MQNREIANIFYDLADLLEIQGENYFKIRAYRNAARIIEGLGLKRVKILYNKLHIIDSQSLKEAALKHKISALPGFGSKTEETILKGLHLLKQEGVRYLFAQVEPIVKDLNAFLQKAPKILSVEITGSFRR